MGQTVDKGGKMANKVSKTADKGKKKKKKKAEK